MSLKFPNGAVFGISTAIAVAIAATAVSNANPAVATVPTGSIDEGDVLVLLSDWVDANNTAVEAGAVTVGASDTVKLLGFDSTDVSAFEAGKANARLAVASGFVDFSQQGDVSTSGGDQQFWTGQFLEAARQISVPTVKNAKVFTIPLFFDPKLPWYAAAKSADRKREPLVLRCKLPDGDVIYRYGYLSFDADPTTAANTPMGNTATFTALGDSVLVEAAA
ncbi:phage tail protein [Luteibacter rhizovicinus DSM 16549]|uniref:Phage tail protein n=1 Tax=Luteibacter rhizovicinus DSM 16549 TaxID=1440763 RepID=A0A0G9HF94_9GAMM|nr:phage tail tube protein [Luteibacter rhizovicinus]APG04956.1 phage tail protein [Luteibacter rhizovicinus DSM 16549]KLD68450.1 tail protein [Luteibacter rhizovicinus DSM 16549]